MTVLMGAQYTIHMPPPYLLHSFMHFYITEKTNCRIFYITLEVNSRFSKESELVWGPHRGFHKPQEICLFPTHFNTSSLAQPTQLFFNTYTSPLAQPTQLFLANILLHNQPNFLLTQAFLHHQPNFLLTQVHLHNQPNFLLTKVILQNQYNFHFNTATPTLIIKVGANWRWFITMSSLKCRQICMPGYL